MCIGEPLRVLRCEEDGMLAWCRPDDEAAAERPVDMRLVGLQPAGTWVLEFQGAARQVMSADDAAATLAARSALAAVLAGAGHADVDRHFADLLDREPQLPPHLRPGAIDR